MAHKVLFTYSNTSSRVVKAPNSPSLPIFIKSTNVSFNPNIPDVHQNLGIEDFVNYLMSCRLRYALNDVPSEFFPEQVCEFYYTATLNAARDTITGTIARGRKQVFITTEILRTALRLPVFEPYSAVPDLAKCRETFNHMGYDIEKAGRRTNLILRQCMPAGWKFLTGAVCKCIGSKSSSGDQLSNFEQQVVCSLLLNKRADFATMFFDQFVQLLRAPVRADHVPYPRWIALVLDVFYAEAYYSRAGDPIPCPRMSHRMYQDDPLANDVGLTRRMRDWIANPYVAHRGDTEDDDEEADINADDQEVNQDEEIAQNSPIHSPVRTQRQPSARGERQPRGSLQLRGSNRLISSSQSLQLPSQNLSP